MKNKLKQLKREKDLALLELFEATENKKLAESRLYLAEEKLNQAVTNYLKEKLFVKPAR